jgi:MFS family permease
MALLEESIGWRTSVLLLGIGLWLVGVPLAMIARNRPEQYGQSPDGDQNAIVGARAVQEALAVAQQAEESNLSASQAIRTRAFWVLTALFAGQFIGLSGLMVHLVALLEDRGYTSTEAATFLGLIFLFSGIGRLGAGFLADMVDGRLVLGALLVSQVIAVVLLTFIGPDMEWQLALFALLLGVGFGGTIPLRPTLIVDLFGPRALGAIQGLMHGASIATGVAGPLMYGWFFDISGSYNIALYISAAAAAVVIPLVFVLRSARSPMAPVPSRVA